MTKEEARDLLNDWKLNSSTFPIVDENISFIKCDLSWTEDIMSDGRVFKSYSLKYLLKIAYDLDDKK